MITKRTFRERVAALVDACGYRKLSPEEIDAVRGGYLEIPNPFVDLPPGPPGPFIEFTEPPPPRPFDDTIAD